MKKILYPIYHFLPCATTHIHRVMRFLNHLVNTGEYEITVLTAKNPNDVMYDEKLIDKLDPRIKIVRTSAWFFGIHNKSKVIASYRADKQDPGKKSSLKELIRQIFRTLIRPVLNMINTPDNCIGWLPFALVKGKKLVSENQYDIIFTTAPPFSNFILSALLKSEETKLVIDYRDPWKNNDYMEKTYIFNWQRWVSQRWETYVLKKTDGVIANTNRMLNFIKDQNSELFSDRIIKTTVIYNGLSFDKEDKLKKKQNSKLLFVHSGRFHGSIRTPKYFLEAMRQLIDEGQVDMNRIVIRFLGNLSPSDFDQIAHIDTREFCQFPGMVPHSENIKQINEADCLVVIGGSGKYDGIYVPSKIFEYLQTPNIILGLLPDGEAKDILQNAGRTVVVDPTDIQGIKDAIVHVMKELQSNESELRNQNYLINNFDSEVLSQKLAAFLKSL